MGGFWGITGPEMYPLKAFPTTRGTCMGTPNSCSSTAPVGTAGPRRGHLSMAWSCRGTVSPPLPAKHNPK